MSLAMQCLTFHLTLVSSIPGHDQYTQHIRNRSQLKKSGNRQTRLIALLFPLIPGAISTLSAVVSFFLPIADDVEEYAVADMKRITT